MLTPTVAAMLMLFVVTRQGREPGVWRGLGLRPSGRAYWPVALLATAAVSVIGLLVALTLPSAHYVTPDGWYSLPIELMIEVALTSVTIVLGEELGWRGYLLPRLRYLGDVKAMIIVGVIHATWHMPVILGTDVEYIDGNRLIIVPLFYGTIMGASFFMGLLRIYSHSVWPASLAHAAHNAMWGITGSFMVASSVTAESYVAGDGGIVILIGVWLAAAGLWLWHQKRDVISAPRIIVAQASSA
jgi:membrane protease YdiL (CAAX protease family)